MLVLVAEHGALAMTQSLHGRQMQASLKLGGALKRLRNAQIVLTKARDDDELGYGHERRLADVVRELGLGIAAIEAAVKEG